MATFAHGIASVQFIDSAGEVVDIKGLDISSLPKTGVINWEHLKTQPNQIVGKIIKAKKIYTEEECSDVNESYFWNKCKVPFVYIIAELLDDYTESAKEVAGILRYDRDNKSKEAILAFSVEGGQFPGAKTGVMITRSVARKVSLTNTPANKMCVCEILPDHKSQVKDDLESIFKSEAHAIEMFKSGQGIKIYEEFLAKKETDMNKSITLSKPTPAPAHGAPGAFGTRPENIGTPLGATTSGKQIFSHAKVNGYHGFSSQDHKEAGQMHAKAAEGSVGNPKLGDHHIQKMKLHNQAAETAVKKEGRFAVGLKAKKDAAKAYVDPMAKTLTAGNMDAAPSTLVNGAAYQKEDLKSKKWSKRAEEEYKNWGKREEFEKFMRKSCPHLADGEIRAIGHAVALNKSIEAEKKITNMFPDYLGKAINEDGPKENWSKISHLGHTIHISSAGPYRGGTGHVVGISPPGKKPTTQTAVWHGTHPSHEAALNHAKSIIEGKKAEKSLENLTKTLKFGSPEDQKAVAAVMEERKKNPPAKKEPYKPEAKLTGPIDSEVSHTITSMGHTSTGTHEFDEVHLKSGHVSHGHPKGKFKTGDKVTMKPHLMGTHILEHKK